MADWRGYFYVEQISLTAGQRATLIAQLQAIGERNNGIYPNERNHWRVRTDGLAVIFEAVFNDALLTAVAMRDRLASIFGVPSANITYATTSTAYGPVVTYSYQSTHRLRMGVFGGAGATYTQSHDAVLSYLHDNMGAWGS